MGSETRLADSSDASRKIRIFDRVTKNSTSLRNILKKLGTIKVMYATGP
jgi:hypothetical protein